jgi:riboflavin kinase/FMN adenylyltransferase
MLIRRGLPSALARPTALTIGNFDGVHLGHQALLSQLKAAANARNLPVSVLTFEPHPREFFAPGAAPARLTTFREKSELLAACRVETLYVQRFDSEFARLSARQFVHDVEDLGARYLLVGDDFRFGKDRAGDFALLKSGSFELRSMASVTLDGERVSSSAIRTALAAGDFAKASRLLGRDYSISGKVVHGDKLGAKIGFPTANVQLKNKRPPLSGIFAVELSGIENARLPGVASLGVRPTISANGKPTLEVHLFDFDANVYGERVSVFFLHKLRDEAKYADIEVLKRQIGKDVDSAKAWFAHRQSAIGNQESGIANAK